MTSGFAVAHRGYYGGQSQGWYYSSVKIVAKKNKTPQPSSPKDSKQAPPRITSNVKQNLRFLRSLKEFQKRKSSSPGPATSYRRKKVEKKEIPDEIPDDDTELYRDRDRDPTLSLYYPINQDIGTGVPVVLVDGYNVCGYWPKLKKHFMNGELGIARQKLIDELVTFSMIREVKVVAVFDAMMSERPTHKETFQGVDIVFTGETCADAWIEKEVEVLRKDGCPKVRVVTSDHCHQLAAHGSGAFVWSCKAFVSEIKASQKELDRMLHENNRSSASVQGKLLKHNLDSKVVEALKDLRDQLLKIETQRK